MDTFYLIFQQTLMVAVAIAVVSIGGMFSERSGVVNIALEGIMIIGAFCGVMFIHVMQEMGSTMNPQIMLLCALACAGIGGAVLSLPLSYASINMKADQTIGGTALNIIAPAIVVFVAVSFIGTDNIQFTNEFLIRDGDMWLSNIPIIGDLFFTKTYITVYIGIAIWVIATFVLYKTKFGLRIRACGEHPQAADSVGISVYKIRYAGVSLSGMLGGMGGLMLIIATVGTYRGQVNGYGFLAISVLIFAQWKPKFILPAAIFFAFVNTIASFNSVIPGLKDLDIPLGVYRMLPYVATLVVLAFTSKKSRAPKAVGVPYDKGKR